MRGMDSQAVVLITGAAGGLANGIVSGITMAFPDRPKWVAFALAILIGVVVSGVAAFAYLPPDVPFNRQMIAQVIIIGIGSGLAAAGLSVSQASAQSRREQVAPTGEPDPMTPQSNPGLRPPL